MIVGVVAVVILVVVLRARSKAARGRAAGAVHDGLQLFASSSPRVPEPRHKGHKGMM